MLGKIIFARRLQSHEALKTFIVVGVKPQYEEGTTYTVVPEDVFGFETLDIFVSKTGLPRNSWEILGVLDAPVYVNHQVARINSLFIEASPGSAADGAMIQWTDETIATAQETIRLLERSIAPPLDGEFGSDFNDDDEDRGPCRWSRSSP